MQYPKIIDSTTTGILATEENKNWKFNTLHNRVRDELNNQPFWLNDLNEIDKVLNPKAFKQNHIILDRLRGDWFFVRLSQDEESRFKIIFKWLLTKEKLF